MKDKEEFKLPLIKTRTDLKNLLIHLDNQGFGYVREYELHDKKMSAILSKNNKLHVKYNSNFSDEIKRMENYDEADKKAQEFFSKFKPDDKIKEYINTLYLKSDDSCRTPWSSPQINDVLVWWTFKTKYQLDDVFGTSETVEIYDLDKKFLKINFYDYYYEFEELYSLIFGEKCSINRRMLGEWQDLGKIEIKVFQNQTANIKGDISEFKKYHYDYLKNKTNNCVIFYNKKKEISKKSRV